VCGIAGIFSEDMSATEHDTAELMLRRLVHRGPDYTACEHRTNFAIGVRRLSIVDVVHGKQPIWSDDGSLIAVLNGEIFNHHALRASLEAQGYTFRSKCDADLIPALYRKYGINFVDHINGQFAIAIFDLRKRVFHAWRDPMGICPFYFSTPRQGVFVFASEIKAICAFPGFEVRLDIVGLDQSFTFPGPMSPTTLFDNISSLPAGHRVSFALGGEPKIQRYWTMTFEEEQGLRSEDEWRDELAEVLEDAVKLRISDEVTTGLYLSGGLDSALIGAFMAPHTSSVLNAFSIDFDDKLISERAYQQDMVEYLGASHHVKILDARCIRDRLVRAVWHTETALRETFNTASLALSEMARTQGVKVALAGQGADELFAGYVGYRFDSRLNRGTRHSTNAEAVANQRLWGDPTFIYERRHTQFDSVRKAIYAPHLRERFDHFNCTERVSMAGEIPSHATVLQRRSLIDLKLRLSDHLLAGHGDRMSMANSVEIRYPFLDPRVVKLAQQLPDSLKLNGMTEKYIVKQVGRSRLPASIINREKFGFTASGSPVLLRLGDELIEYYLSEEKLKRDNVFDTAEVARISKMYRIDGFRINVPFETDLLITVITYGMLSEAFGITPA
jgi:asparagine synthase (glutamine-hydrolysing)